jgi:predicted metal-dependent phosphotriesterase family hydrolase
MFGAAATTLLAEGCARRGVRPAAANAASRAMTVRGWIDASDMGLTLPHEHALVSFQPYAEWAVKPLAYDRDEVVAVVLPRLRRLRELGCRTFVDATPMHVGRDPALLRRLSEESGLHVLTPTGNYAARENSFLPPHVHSLSAASLADRWIREWTDGIDGTGVRPGFIKLGFNGRALSEVERKIIHAGALTHRQTGLVIGAHTGPAVSALEQLAVLEREGVHPSAWIWIHAQGEPDSAQHIAAAKRGAWIEFDGIDSRSLERHVAFVTRLRDAGLLDHVLISQDAGWYNVGQPRGGTFRSYEVVFTEFLPALRARGFSAAEIDTLLVRNPAKAFSVSVRKID